MGGRIPSAHHRVAHQGRRGRRVLQQTRHVGGLRRSPDLLAGAEDPAVIDVKREGQLTSGCNRHLGRKRRFEVKQRPHTSLLAVTLRHDRAARAVRVLNDIGKRTRIRRHARIVRTSDRKMLRERVEIE